MSRGWIRLEPMDEEDLESHSGHVMVCITLLQASCIVCCMLTIIIISDNGVGLSLCLSAQSPFLELINIEKHSTLPRSHTPRTPQYILSFHIVLSMNTHLVNCKTVEVYQAAH
jgi:hypothetical protein